MAAERVEIGLVGWRHERWTGEFYPEDLPVEWRLGYYANEFRRVWVPASYLVDPDAFAPQDWCAQTDPSFRFVVELPEDWGWREVEARLGPLLARGSTLLLPPTVPAGGPWRRGGNRAVPRQAVWSPDTGPGSGAPVGLVPAVHDPSPRTLRAWLEAFVTQAGPGQADLIVQGVEPAALAMARQLRTLAELMGL
jgi:hypothetical protein